VRCRILYYASAKVVPTSIFVEIFLVGAGIFVYFGEVQGHPRSLILVPLESAYATSY